MHSAIGWNARRESRQGAVLRLKLPQLDSANAARQKIARVYDAMLDKEFHENRSFLVTSNNDVYHIYAVRVRERNSVAERMAARGVQCGIHYPVPIHLQKAYSFLVLMPGSFPIAERCAREFLSLPMFPELQPEQVE